MGEISKILGLAEKIKHAGKEYGLAPITFEIMGQWEQYLEDRAFAALERHKRRYGPIEYAQKEQELLAAITAGDYSFFSSVSGRALSGNPLGPCRRKMVLFRMQAAAPQDGSITEDLANQICEEEADQLCFLQQKMDAADPNFPCPEAGAESVSKPSPPDSSLSLSA